MIQLIKLCYHVSTIEMFNASGTQLKGQEINEVELATS